MPTRLPVDDERFAEFAASCLVRDDGERLPARDLYAAYWRWCEQHRYFVLSQTMLGRMMGEHGFERFTVNGRVIYRGVRLAARRQSGSARDFVARCLIRDDSARLSAFDLFTAYRRWCQENGFMVLTRTMLGRLMGAYGFRRFTSVGRVVYRGVRLAAGTTTSEPAAISNANASTGNIRI